MPNARKIGIKTTSVVTKFFSYKMNRIVECESLLESNLCYILEFNRSVLEYIEQPFTLSLGNFKYTPDFHVIHNNGHQEVYEVKEFKKLEDLKEKLPIIETYFTNKGFSFKLVTDKDINGILNTRLCNFKFLYRYIKPPKNFDNLKNLIFYKISRSKKFSIEELLSLFNEEQRVQILPALWHLIATGIVLTNFDEPLITSTIISFENIEV